MEKTYKQIILESVIGGVIGTLISLGIAVSMKAVHDITNR